MNDIDKHRDSTSLQNYDKIHDSKIGQSNTHTPCYIKNAEKNSRSYSTDIPKWAC